MFKKGSYLQLKKPEMTLRILIDLLYFVNVGEV